MNPRPWLAHYDKGVPQTIKYPPVPIFHFLEESARKYPDQPCTIFKGAAISFKEMDAITDQLAAALAGMPGDERTVILLAYREELTQTEIAEILGVSPSRVTQLLTRALAFLRVRLESAAA